MSTATPPGFVRAASSERARRVRFRRAVTLMVMTLLAPGSAQVVAGNRRVGMMALRIAGAVVLLVAVAALVGLLWRPFAFWAAFNPTLLGVLRWTLIGLAVGWAFLFMDAWRLGQPLSLQQNQRLAVVGINGVLCLSVAGALIFGAHVVGVQRDFTIAMSSDGAASAAEDGRYNVLLVGGDAGKGRWGLRTDSMTVASIDEETGRTVLISLPRNMTNFPFAEGSVMDKAWPQGYNCGYPDCELNSVNTWVGENRELFKGVEDPGMNATISAVEGITGLKINYWAMVNLEGFKGLVDAVGGVRLNVRQPIPVGLPNEKTFHYIDPGTRTLNGHDTLWFARAREGSDDYSRMARQKCVMNAMLHQVSPKTMLTNFTEIASASSDMVSTNVPSSEFGRFIDLALKARGQKVSTVSLVPPAVDTSDPDIDKIQEMIQKGIDQAEGTAKAAPKKKKPAGQSGMTGGSLGSLSEGYVANQADDLGAAC
ncbi:LCP family protein [Nocardioides rotundus]|nr:LCP family protein [Nocardioides rotundus]